jgi:hypothetical protein
VPVSAQSVEKSINQFRMKASLRVLWPDYEVYDLLADGVSVEELAHFTSSPLTIEKIGSE